MNPLTWQNPWQLFVAQDIIKVKIYSVAELRLFSSYLSAMSRNNDIMKSYTYLVTTMKDYSVTSINIEEVHVCYDLRFKGIIVLKNPKFRYVDQNIIFPYIQAKKNVLSWLNCIFSETESYMVSIPV